MKTSNFNTQNSFLIKLKITLALLFSILFSLKSYSQNFEFPDSIQVKIDTIKNTEKKADFLMRTTWVYLNSDIELAYELISSSVEISKQENYTNGLANGYTTLGVIFQQQGDYLTALEYQFQSLELYQKLNAEEKSKRIEQNISTAYNNIGNTYFMQNDLDNSIKYYEKALEIRKKAAKNSQYYNTLSNIAGVYFKKGDYEKAIKIYTGVATEFKKDFPDIEAGSLFQVMSNIADCYIMMEKYEKAINTFKEGGKYYKEGEIQHKLSALLNQSGLYIEMNKPAIAHQKLIEAEAILKKENIKTKHNYKSFYEYAYDYYKSVGNHQKALQSHEKFLAYKDSIFNDEQQDKVNSLNNQIKIKEKEAELKMIQKESENQLKLLTKDNRIKEEKLEREAYLKYTFFGFGLFSLIIGLLFYRRFKINKRLNAKIVEKNKEIYDSIEYARGLQEAILPSKDTLSYNLKDYFVFFQPKDIVSGDFYWVESVKIKQEMRDQYDFLQPDDHEITYVAVADCTGHGVPGALVSVVCSSALYRSLKESNLLLPNEILKKSRDIIVKEFSNQTTTLNDGMDVSLCALIKSKEGKVNKGFWSGANSPLWLVRDDQLKSFTPDKMSVGKGVYEEAYQLHPIDFQKNDVLYFTSDGFQDQFGGNNTRLGKKFKSKQLKELMVNIHQKDLKEQQSILSKTFHQWKGDLDQVDDVCIIGVRL